MRFLDNAIVLAAEQARFIDKARDSGRWAHLTPMQQATRAIELQNIKDHAVQAARLRDAIERCMVPHKTFEETQPGEWEAIRDKYDVAEKTAKALKEFARQFMAPFTHKTEMGECQETDTDTS